MAATGPIFDEIQKFLRPSDRELPGDYFGLWNFWKRSFLAWVTDDQSLVPNRGTFCPVFTPSVTFSGFHCFHFHCVLFLVISFQTPPQKSVPEGLRPSGLALLRNAVALLGLRPSGTDFWGGVINPSQILPWIISTSLSRNKDWLVDNFHNW